MKSRPRRKRKNRNAKSHSGKRENRLSPRRNQRGVSEIPNKVTIVMEETPEGLGISIDGNWVFKEESVKSKIGEVALVLRDLASRIEKGP